MSSTTKGLTERAKYLRNAAPQQFDAFVAEVRIYTAAVTQSLIYTTDNVQVVQGQAQQCLKFIEALEEVTKHG
jgi:hypothetical protein